MKYTVIDLSSGETLTSGTCQEVACWWRKKFRDYKGDIIFDELNVTGKDTVARQERDGYIKVRIGGEPHWVPKSKTVYYLRRYQVLDENGHPVDIRSWSKDVWEYEPPHQGFTWSWLSGNKPHHHRTSGPSMWRGTFSASMKIVDNAELQEDSLPLPTRDNTGVRLPFNTSTVWDYYDDHAWHPKSKSWKDQTKARKQWAKHKPNDGKSQRREDEWARLDPEWTDVAETEESPFSGGSGLQEAA